MHVTELPTRWIHGNAFKPRKLRVWRSKPYEREVFYEEGGSLVEKEVLRHKGKRAHPSGIFDRIIIKSIDPSDSDTIDQHEIDSLAVFPATNERLYLCQKVGRNVDPDKDIMFDRKMPVDYLTYVDIGLAAIVKEKRRLLALFNFSRTNK